MKNDMKLIMENWREKLLENTEQSDGGEVLTASELDQIVSFDLKSGLEAVKSQLEDTIKKNKDKIKKLKTQEDEKLVKEFVLGSLWLALQTPALIISLTQLAGKGAVWVAKKFGRGPTDPESPYFNDFHEKVDSVLDWIKRQFQSVGIHAYLQAILKYIYRNNEAKYQKQMATLNLIMDSIMFVICLSMMYQNWDKIKEAIGLAKVKAAFGNSSAIKTVFDSIDVSFGIKDLFKNIFKKFVAN